ncbi:hypothetical protein AURDEDRAFT_113876 [Auricularia subglabra TFB-10046 SS5]|nr:hypothetical protein AURDEDRAFT_113876 [Auricularia subglabra TFB-10046 SS5]
MAVGRLLHARQSRAGDATIAPGIGGSAVLAPTGTVGDGLNLDGGINPTPFVNPSQDAFSTPFPSPSADDQSLVTSPSATPTPQSPSGGSHRSTIIIACAAAGALFLIGLATLLLFCRSGYRKKDAAAKSRPREKDGGHEWREIESQQSHAAAHAAYAAERKELYSYHSRKSSEAPPSIHLEFEPTPLMAENPFDGQHSPRSPIPPVPAVPHPHSASYDNSRAPSEYSVSPYRSVYSNNETGSVLSQGTTRSRSGTLKRSGSSKSRNHKELIALDNLIQALDLNAQDEKARQRQLDPGNVNSQRESYIPTNFPLPPPAVFRAALGSGDE